MSMTEVNMSMTEVIMSMTEVNMSMTEVNMSERRLSISELRVRPCAKLVYVHFVCGHALNLYMFTFQDN